MTKEHCQHEINNLLLLKFSKFHDILHFLQVEERLELNLEDKSEMEFDKGTVYTLKLVS